MLQMCGTRDWGAFLVIKGVQEWSLGNFFEHTGFCKKVRACFDKGIYQVVNSSNLSNYALPL